MPIEKEFLSMDSFSVAYNSLRDKILEAYQDIPEVSKGVTS
jgi:hypothetical protein